MKRRDFLVGAALLAAAGCAPKRTVRPYSLYGVDFLELVHPQPDASLPPIIALPGHGSRPEDWAPPFAKFPGRGRILIARGLEKNGLAWFTGDPADGLVVAADRVAAAMGKGVVTGYAEGAMLALVLAARHPNLTIHAFAVAGACPRSLLPAPGPRPPAAIVAYRGGKDPDLRADDVRSTIEAFQKAGADALLREYPEAGHDPSAKMHADLEADILASLR